MKAMNGNGVGDAFQRGLLGVVAVLMAAGVIGLWSTTQTLTRLEERVASWTRVFEARFEKPHAGSATSASAP